MRAEVAEAEVWNPATGSRRPARVTVSDIADGAVSTIEVPLDGAPAALVVWREGRAAPTPPERESPDRVLDLSAGWHGRLIPTLDNTWGDLALPPGTSVDEPQIWTMGWTEGTVWERARATYGNRVRVLPPVPLGEAPEPLDAERAGQVVAGELPLVPPDAGWGTAVYSSSRGIPDPGGLLGIKGLVNEEFVRVPVPVGATAARVRTIVETDHRGPAELHVGAEARKRVWWNGERLDPDGEGYVASARVTVARDRNVLEYELSDAQSRPSAISAEDGTPLGSFFCLSAPGGLGPRPRFMRPPGRCAAGRPGDVPRAAAGPGRGRAGGARGGCRLGGHRAARRGRRGAAGEGGVLRGGLGRRTAVLPPRTGARGGRAHPGGRGRQRRRPGRGVRRPGGAVRGRGDGPGQRRRLGGRDGRVAGADRRGRAQAGRGAALPRRGTAAPAAGHRVAHRPAGARRRRMAVAVHRRRPPAPQRFRFTVPAGTVSLDLPLALPASVCVGDGPESPLDGRRLALRQPLPAPTPGRGGHRADSGPAGRLRLARAGACADRTGAAAARRLA